MIDYRDSVDSIRRSMTQNCVANLKSRTRMMEMIEFENWDSENVLSFVLDLIPKALASDVEQCRQGCSMIRGAVDAFQEFVLCMERFDTKISGKAKSPGSVSPGDC